MQDTFILYDSFNLIQSKLHLLESALFYVKHVYNYTCRLISYRGNVLIRRKNDVFFIILWRARWISGFLVKIKFVEMEFVFVRGVKSRFIYAARNTYSRAPFIIIM